jgi:hypothetical protein
MPLPLKVTSNKLSSRKSSSRVLWRLNVVAKLPAIVESLADRYPSWIWAIEVKAERNPSTRKRCIETFPGPQLPTMFAEMSLDNLAILDSAFEEPPSSDVILVFARCEQRIITFFGFGFPIAVVQPERRNTNRLARPCIFETVFL